MRDNETERVGEIDWVVRDHEIENGSGSESEGGINM